jgi:hypothetical protein
MALLIKEPWHFVDENEISITSYERIQELIKKGYLFEACAVQSFVLDCMLGYVILLKSMDKPHSEGSQIKNGLYEKPMGGLISVCEEYKLFDSDFIQRLYECKEKRNSLVHHHLKDNLQFDYNQFIEESNILIETLFKQIQPVLEKKSSEID